MHLIIKTRSDLAYSVFHLIKFSNNPIDKHWKTLKEVLHYLQETKVLGFCYTCVSSLLSFLALTNASWREIPGDSCFRSRFVILLAGGSVAY